MYRFWGVILVAISAAAFGTLAIFGRYAYADGMDVQTVLFLRFLLSGVVVIAILVARRESLPRGSIWLPLVGMGAIGYVGQATCYLTALYYASAGLVALLLYTYPAFVAVLSILLFRERITRPKVLALGLALVGTALTVGPGGGQWLGVLLALSGAGIYSVYIIVATRVLERVSPLQSSAVILVSAGVTSGLLMLLGGPQFPATASGWAAIAGLVLITTVLPILTFLAGLQRIGPTNAAMVSTLEPVVTVLLAAWLFGEALRPITLLGGALILAAVLLLARATLGHAEPPSLA